MAVMAVLPGGGCTDIKRYLSASFSALSSRDYRLFVVGQGISVSGVWMQKLGQAWLVLTLTDSGLMLGVTVALQQVPTLIFSTFGGRLADRYDRRKILMATAICGAVPAVTVGALAGFHVVTIWMVMAAALIAGFVDAVEKPARWTVANDIVPPHLLTNAVTLNNILQDSGKLIGPAIGGILIAVAGIPAAFFVNAATAVPMVVAMALIRPKWVTPRSERAQGGIVDALRYVAHSPVLLAALVLQAVTGLWGYNFQVLVPLVFRDVLGGDARSVGLGLTCLGLGGVCGGLMLAGLLKAGSRRQICAAALFAAALATLAVSPTLWFGYCAIAAVGVCSVVYRSISGSLLQLASDPQMRGRVMSLYVLAMAGTTPIGAPIQGAIAQLSNARVSLAVAAVTILVSCVVAYLYLRAKALDHPVMTEAVRAA